METIQRKGEPNMKEDRITEYHCCIDCKDMIEVPGRKPNTWEVGCLNSKGNPNPTGGLCRCDYYRG